MSETQRYKLGKEFTLPAVAVDIVRPLFEARLKTVVEVIEDPNALKVFSKNEFVALAFERLMLAKMIEQMPPAEVENA